MCIFEPGRWHRCCSGIGRAACVRLRTWVLVPLQGALGQGAAAGCRCCVRLGVGALQGAAAVSARGLGTVGAAAVRAWELGRWCCCTATGAGAAAPLLSVWDLGRCWCCCVRLGASALLAGGWCRCRVPLRCQEEIKIRDVSRTTLCRRMCTFAYVFTEASPQRKL